MPSGVCNMFSFFGVTNVITSDIENLLETFISDH